MSLEPKAHDVLLALVRKAGRLVTKRELLELVWPESFVEEGILAVHISGLRKALSDDARRYIQTVPRSGYRFTGTVTQRDVDPGGSADRCCIAVLPAQPLTTEILGNGRELGLAIADSVIDRLGRFKQLVVRPTRAVHTYLNIRRDPAEVGRALHVDVVIDCHFVNVVDGIRVAAHLVRSWDGVRLWSGEFGEPATALAAIPDAIAQSVATHLGLSSRVNSTTRLGHGTEKRFGVLARRPEVYELFGRGRTHLLSASMYEVPKAVAAFRSAVDLDPTYAAAHAGLALACCAQAEFRIASCAEAYGSAKSSALRALAMDESCADAQVALGAVLFLSEWNWVGAERSLERALDLNPNHTEAYLLYGRLLEALGQLQRGLEMKQKALERDPFSPLVHLQISMSYWNQRRYDDSIEWANRALALDPHHLLAREHLAGAYWKKGDFDRQMAEMIKHAESYGVPSDAFADLEAAYSTGGRQGVVQYVLQQASRQEQSPPHIQLAIYNGEAGNMDAAFHHLERAIESRDPCLAALAVAPQWDSLRADPRFNRCLARMGLSNGPG